MANFENRWEQDRMEIKNNTITILKQYNHNILKQEQNLDTPEQRKRNILTKLLPKLNYEE